MHITKNQGYKTTKCKLHEKEFINQLLSSEIKNDNICCNETILGILLLPARQ